jgi:anionic cell wall polymer biosynthesis LytR-Cps2A-Psr (LCP) family protein
VQECNTQPINDPLSGLKLTAGQHMLTPSQALAYVRARYTLGNGSDLERITRQQAFMSSLIHRVKSKLLNPVAIYQFLDAATKSLTIDTKLGGVTGLYDLASSLRNLPSSKVAFFTLPNYPRSEVVPADTANVLWSQPQDGAIFRSFQEDVPASESLFSPAAGSAATASSTASPSPGATSSGSSGTSGATGPSSSPSAGASPQPTPTATPSQAIPSARTANQNICTG